MGIISVYLDSIWERVAWKEGRAGNPTLSTLAFMVLARGGGASRGDRRCRQRMRKTRRELITDHTLAPCLALTPTICAQFVLARGLAFILKAHCSNG